MDKFAQALAYLLPSGFAWPRDPNSVLMRVLRGLAASFAELHLWSQLTVRHWQPISTTRLAEWEAACGLPDTCLGADQSEALRRSLLLARLRGPHLAYADSSPAALQGLEDILTGLGFAVRLRYNTPFRAGRNRVGERLGALNGILYVVMLGQANYFRVGQSRVGSPLASYPQDVGALLCYLNRLIPARFSIQFVFSET